MVKAAWSDDSNVLLHALDSYKRCIRYSGRQDGASKTSGSMADASYFPLPLELLDVLEHNPNRADSHWQRKILVN